jgi:hypothetical protein
MNPSQRKQVIRNDVGLCDNGAVYSQELQIDTNMPVVNI